MLIRHLQKQDIDHLPILTLEINIFGLKMMVKSGLEIIILTFHEPLQADLPSGIPARPIQPFWAD